MKCFHNTCISVNLILILLLLDFAITGQSICNFVDFHLFFVFLSVVTSSIYIEGKLHIGY